MLKHQMNIVASMFLCRLLLYLVCNQISMLHCALGLYDSGRNSLNMIGLLNEVMLLACVGVRSSELKHNVLLSLFSQRG